MNNLSIRSRPELGEGAMLFRNYIEHANRDEKVDKAMTNVKFLRNAMEYQYAVDAHLIENNVISKENPCIPALELALLKVATLEVTDSVFYYITIQHQDRFVVRYFESGSYLGMMKQVGAKHIADSLNIDEGDLLLYRVYTRSDIEKMYLKDQNTSLVNARKRRRKDDNLRESTSTTEASLQQSDVNGTSEQDAVFPQRNLRESTSSLETSLQQSDVKSTMEQDTVFPQQSSESTTNLIPSEEQVQIPKSQRNDYQHYVRQMHSLKSSVHNQVMLALQALQNDNRFSSGLVHVLRKNANPTKLYHRYIHKLCGDEEICSLWNSMFTSFKINGCHTEDITFKDFLCQDIQSLTLAEQYNILSSISNFHWEPYLLLNNDIFSTIPLPSLLQHLSYPKKSEAEPPASSELNQYAPPYYPTSFRNRLIYFYLNNSFTYVKKCLSHLFYIDHSCHKKSASDSSVQKKRVYTPRIVKITPTQVGIKTNIFRANRSLYIQFRESLITDGHIFLRVQHSSHSTYLMNTYSLDTGHMFKNSYSHLHIVHELNQRPFAYCTCEAYAFLESEMQTKDPQDVVLDPSTSCWHTEFYFECISTLDSQSNSHLQLKISKNQANENVVPIGQLVPNQPATFSVMASNGDCCFVNLSQHGKWMVCQSGSCQAKMVNKKKAPAMLSLESVNVCEHLALLREERQMWQHLVKELEDMEEMPSEDLNNEDVGILEQCQQTGVFNTVTGMWNFGGLSSHKPCPEVDLQLTRSVQKRWTINDITHSRNGGFLVGPDLQPGVPDHCACGAGFDEYAELEKDYKTKLYTKNAPIQCWVMRRRCTSGLCVHQYSGDTDNIHQWSHEAGLLRQ